MLQGFRIFFVLGAVLLAVSVQAAKEPSLKINPVGPKAYGDDPFTVSVAGTSAEPVQWSVSGPAEMAGNIVNLTGAGKVVITATQGGATAALNVNVKQAVVVATADSFTIASGAAFPITLTVSYSGFVNGEDESVLDQAPVPSIKAAVSLSRFGEYAIKLSPAKDDNYKIVKVEGTLTVAGGGSGLVKSGGGTLTLSGTSTYTGDTIVIGGTLSIGNSPGTLDFGTAGLTVSGAGTLTLTGANTYTSGIVISGGTLFLAPVSP